MATATYVAAAINVAVSGLGFRLRREPATTDSARRIAAAEAAPSRRRAPSTSPSAFPALTALGAEVVWTRLLSLMLGATVYTFSIILAVFLTGLGLGSGAASHWSRGKTPASRPGDVPVTARRWPSPGPPTLSPTLFPTGPSIR